MQRPLDPLRFKQNRYERPNQDWVCGRAAAGRACSIGPDDCGNCRAVGECIPAKKGDRWHCTRDDSQGGKCERGPFPDGSCSHAITPCQPVPSLRRARGSLVWVVTALSAGALLILFGSNLRHRWTDPGDLTNAHATSAAKCSDCHGVAGNGPPPALAANHPRLTDSALCLKCHSLGEDPFRPHGVTAARLSALAQKVKPGPHEASSGPVFLRVSRVLSRADAHSSELACTTCHQEHHGRNFDLKALTNKQCQTCHTVQFASFSKGHPDFHNYPYRGRTPIFFDHASHVRQHFAEMKEKAPKACQACHIPDPAGRFMKVKSFEQTCAACHEAQIKGAGMTVKGVPFFTVPGIDVDTLAGRGITIGDWPKFADGKITPFMELLLRRQPAMRDALTKLAGIDLLDLSKATPDQLAAAERFAWGVKELLFHLVVDGQSYLLAELKDQIAPEAVAVPRSTLLAAQTDWMPHLLSEVSNYEKGIKPPLPERPQSTPSATPPPNDKPKTGDDSLEGDLSGGSGDDLTAAAAESPSPSPTGGGSGDDLAGGDLLEAGASETPAPSATPAAAPAVEEKSAEEWAAAGGWYRPRDSFTVYYRPAGHADSFLAAWLNTTAQMAGTGAPSAGNAIFRQLADPQTAGTCMKCHTVDSSDGTTRVQWLPAEALPKKKSFTTFRHTTHLSLFGNTACETCHTIDRKADYAKYFRGEGAALAEREPTRFQSSFAPLSKNLCIQCHLPKVAGDSCLLCHRYHAGAISGEIASGNSLQPLLDKK